MHVAIFPIKSIKAAVPLIKGSITIPKLQHYSIFIKHVHCVNKIFLFIRLNTFRHNPYNHVLIIMKQLP